MKTKMKQFKYYTNCVSIPSYQVNDLIEMVNDSNDITYETFIKNCDCLNMFKSLGYVINGNGLKIKDDYCVSFEKSKFINETCYFFKWSGIEYIFIKA